MELFVEGTSCNFEDHPRTLQMKNCTRKLYVEGFFSTENTHEIANNYRNNKRRIPRRRRKSSVKFPKPSQNDPYHREVFQIPCFIYPRFSEVFPWRGRRSICKQNPPDGLLNDLVKRIQIASTLEDLKRLSHYRLKVANSVKKRPRNHPSSSSHSSTFSPLRTEDKFQTVTKIARRGTATKSNQHCAGEKRKLGDIRSTNHPLTTLNVKDWPTGSRTGYKGEQNSRFATDDSRLIQLASDFYDEGLLAHLRYLEKVGDKKPASDEESEVSLAGSAHSSVSAFSTRSEFRHLSGESSGNLFTNTIRRIVNTKRPAIKRNRRPNLRILKDDSISLPLSSQQSTDCRIRVEITSATNRTNRVQFEQHPSSELIESSSVDSTSEHPLDGNESMRGLVTSPDTNHRYGSFSSRAHLNGNRNFETALRAVDRNDNFSELINSLYRLDIAAELGSLPKIVLTDFSSSQDTSATSTPSFIATTPASRLVGSQKPVNFVELTDFDRCLNIPSETNYRSEARPP